MNQCDGCNAGIPIVEGVHKAPYPSGPMVCTKRRYTMNKEDAEVTKQISDVTLAITEGKSVIVLEETQAGMVFNDDGSIELYFPDVEDEDAPAGPGALMCVTVARSVAEDSEFWLKRLDDVFDIAEELEAVSSDTEEDTDDSVQG